MVKIKVFLSADRTHIIVAEMKGRYGDITKYTKHEGTANIPKHDFKKRVERFEIDDFYVKLEK